MEIDLSKEQTRDSVLVVSVIIHSEDVETVTIRTYVRSEEGDISKFNHAHFVMLQTIQSEHCMRLILPPLNTRAKPLYLQNQKMAATSFSLQLKTKSL